MPSLGNGTYHPAEISYWDKSKEVGRFGVYGVPVTEGNFAAQSALWAPLVTATNGITAGLIRSARWVNEVVSNANPEQDSIDQSASREIKLLVQFIDNTTQKRLTSTVPTLDLTKVTYLPQARDFVAITDAQGASEEIQAFVSAFEGYVINPATGNAVTIVGLKVVGRNN